jgi:hypothetical protein
MTLSKRSQLEAHIEKKSCQYAESLDWDHIKLDKAKRKWPDRLFLGPNGQKLLVEFKRPGEVPRPQQDAFFYRLGKKFHKVHLIESVDQFKALLDYSSNS